MANLRLEDPQLIENYYEQHNFPFWYRTLLPYHLVKKAENLNAFDLNEEIAQDYFNSWFNHLKITQSVDTFDIVTQFFNNRDLTLKNTLQSLIKCINHEKSFFGGENDPEVKQLNRDLVTLSTNLTNIKRIPQTNSIITQEAIAGFIEKFTNIRTLVQLSLFAWQQNQSYPDNNNKVVKLDIIESWYNRIYNMLSELKSVLLKFPGVYDQNIAMIDTLLSELLIRSLIFEDQPKQVIIKGSKFSMKLRYLVPVDPGSIRSTAFLIPERLAYRIYRSEYDANSPNPPEQYGKLAGNTSMYNRNETSIIHFNDLRIKKVSRVRNNDNSRVTEEKACFFFQNTFQKNGQQYIGWALSIPVIIAVHNHQEKEAWAKIVWDNSYARHHDLNAFNVPNEIEIDHLLERMNHKFAEAVGREMTPLNIDMLKTILIANTNVALIDNSSMRVNYDTFCRNLIIANRFTFWDWFYNAMKQLKDSEVLRKMFTDSLFMGFVSGNAALNYLNQSNEGTFLIRFSESCLSAVTISCKGLEGVVHSGFERDRLNGSFSEIVFTMINALQFFYPHVDKREVSQRYVSALPNRPGYRPITYWIDKLYNWR